MKKILCIVLVLLLFSSSIFAATEDEVRLSSSVSDFTIIFSNIAKPGGSQTRPATLTPITVVGKSISPGYAMVKLTDLTCLGATVQEIDDNFYIYINGQVITFSEGSNSYSSCVSYTIDDPASGLMEYNLSFTGATEIGSEATFINSVPYVRLTAAAHQCGALIISYDSASKSTYVFDFRVNGDYSGYDDDNTYIVGGSWLDNWDSKGSFLIAPHFKINELWYTSTTGTYHNQLKISAASLQTEENIRYYYNNGSSINVTSGFRTWSGNFQTNGADTRSLHMRGRAIDATSATTQSLYNQLYDEFRGEYSEPINGGSISWYSRVHGTSASLSGAYDLEKMPHNGSWWIHLGVTPQYTSPM